MIRRSPARTGEMSNQRQLNSTMYRLAPQHNLLRIIGMSLIYLIIFRLLFQHIGENIVALSMIPMLLAGWYYGWAGGLLSIIVLVSINMGVFYLTGFDGLAMVINQGPGLMVAVPLTAGAGWIRTLLERQRLQTDALNREREALLSEIAARQRAEHALQEAKEAAEAASRAKSAFLSNVSHELRTPLTVILGFCELALLEAQQQGQAQIQHDIEKIQQSGKHLLQLINTVLDLSKIEAGRFEITIEPVPLRQLIAEVQLIAAQLMLAQQNKLQIRWVAEESVVLADPIRLRQTLINLLSNAAKFTRNGTVTLTISQRPASGGDRIVFSIADTGEGIPAHMLPKLFEPFTQMSNGQEQPVGTGLGLTISRHFCRLMGGDIQISSEAGQGTTVCFDLQAAPQAAPVTA